MRLRIIVLVTTLVAGISAGYVVIMTPMLRAEVSAIKQEVQNGSTDKHSRLNDDAELAVRGLWAADDSKREAAKRELIRLGPRATESLTALLKDLLENPGLRFVPGKEKEGQEAWDHYMRLSSKQKDDKAYRRLRSLEISSRLKEDAFELVGQLRAVEAISLLIEFMRSDISVSLAEKWRPDMRALVEIGPAAVTDIMEAIETARSQASTRVAQDPSLIEPGKRRMGGYEDIDFLARCITVLGEIGDPDALPVLRSLLVDSKNEVLLRDIKEAIQRIEDRHRK